MREKEGGWGGGEGFLPWCLNARKTSPPPLLLFGPATLPPPLSPFDQQQYRGQACPIQNR